MLFRCAIKYHPTWKYENININGSCTTGSFGTFIVERVYARQQHWMETRIVVIGCYKLYCLNLFLSSASSLFFFFNVSFFVCFGSLLCLHTYTAKRDIFKTTAIMTATTTTTTMYTWKHHTHTLAHSFTEHRTELKVINIRYTQTGRHMCCCAPLTHHGTLLQLGRTTFESLWAYRPSFTHKK